MKSKNGLLKACNRGHKFYKSSDCPVCPKCWSGYYKDKLQSDFPKKLSAPALRALLSAKINTLKQLTLHTKDEVLKLHGMGPSGIVMIDSELKKHNLAFKKS